MNEITEKDITNWVSDAKRKIEKQCESISLLQCRVKNLEGTVRVSNELIAAYDKEINAKQVQIDALLLSIQPKKPPVSIL